MRNQRFGFISILLLSFILQYCASPISPSGGPRDTIPPILLESIPIAEQVNYNEKTIKLTFDEYISSDQVKNNLVITPSTENKYVAQVKKNSVILKFDEYFEDSTTFTFNFFKGITDITEKNPAENLILAFSTGPVIDSLQIKGRIKDLLTQELEEEITIGLYLLHDSLDYTKEKPRYFINSDKSGTFTLRNIKSDIYKLFAFKDENNNLLFDAAEEKHAFLSDSILLESNIDSVTLNSILLDVTPVDMLTARPSGNYFEVRYNKAIKTYTVHNTDSLYNIYTRPNTEQDAIRFYNQAEYPDSIQTIIRAYDTLHNFSLDTVYLKFNSSNKKKEPLSLNLLPKDKSKFQDTLQLTFSFNKPITSFNSSLIYIAADSLLKVPLDSLTPTITPSSNRNSFDISCPFDWQAYSDSVIQIINDQLPDSVTQIEQISRLDLVIDKGAFISVEKDSSEAITRTYNQQLQAEVGTINYIVELTYPSFFVELIDKKFNTIQRKKNLKQGSFTQVPPGQYSLRVLIDLDQNGAWTYGNLSANIAPEPVYVYSKFTELRSKWDITIEDFRIDNL